MKPVMPPTPDATGAFRAISATRRPLAVRNRLVSSEPNVLMAYGTYQGDPDTIVSLAPTVTAPATKEDLQGNYASRSGPSTQLRSSIYANNVGGRCCYCAQRRAGTLDHYLPQDVYPEFSVLPLNLVPACWDCNHTKLVQFVRLDGGATFLHPYFESGLEKVRFLYADVRMCGNEPTVAYYVDPPAEVPNDRAIRIRSHFARLKLAEYYLFEAGNELGERRMIVETLWDRGATDADIESYLRSEAASVGKFSGVNHWRFALLDALADQRGIYKASEI
jgi:hypothetical protein